MRHVMLLMCALCVDTRTALTLAASVYADSRMRTVGYSPEKVYSLRGYVGYQIDLEFEPGEAFVGLGAGDVEGLTFSAQDNHLFIKPKAALVRTNLTVLTSRRSYHFDYTVPSADGPARNAPDLVYTLRFAYPVVPAATDLLARAETERALDRAPEAPLLNRDYWYCGVGALLPLAAFDDGVHTHLRFNPHGELPALFVRNDDGSESLLNFNIEHGEVVIHRVARQFVVRRGRLAGCIVNKSFDGPGRELRSGTVTPQVERATRASQP